MVLTGLFYNLIHNMTTKDKILTTAGAIALTGVAYVGGTLTTEEEEKEKEIVVKEEIYETKEIVVKDKTHKIEEKALPKEQDKIKYIISVEVDGETYSEENYIWKDKKKWNECRENKTLKECEEEIEKELKQDKEFRTGKLIEKINRSNLEDKSDELNNLNL